MSLCEAAASRSTSVITTGERSGILTLLPRKRVAIKSMRDKAKDHPEYGERWQQNVTACSSAPASLGYTSPRTQSGASDG